MFGLMNIPPHVMKPSTELSTVLNLCESEAPVMFKLSKQKTPPDWNKNALTVSFAGLSVRSPNVSN